MPRKEMLTTKAARRRSKKERAAKRLRVLTEAEMRKEKKKGVKVKKPRKPKVVLARAARMTASEW